MAERLPSRYTYASDLLFKIAKYTVGITGVLSVGYVAAESLDADSEADTTFVDKYSDDITGIGMAMATGATFLFWTGGVACRSDEMQWYKESSQAEAILQTLPKFEEPIREINAAIESGIEDYELDALYFIDNDVESDIFESKALTALVARTTFSNAHRGTSESELSQLSTFSRNLDELVKNPSRNTILVYCDTDGRGVQPEFAVPTNVACVGTFLDDVLPTHEGEQSWTTHLIKRWQATLPQNA